MANTELRIYSDDPSSCETGCDRQRLPVEVGLSIMGAGLVGLVLPGPLGMPLIIAGGLSLWPTAFRPADQWFRRRWPKVHASGEGWIERFTADLERRYPTNAQFFESSNHIRFRSGQNDDR